MIDMIFLEWVWVLGVGGLIFFWLVMFVLT